MNIIYLRRVRRLFTNDLTPVKTQRHNMRQWVKSVRMLGSKWRALPKALELLKEAD